MSKTPVAAKIVFDKLPELRGELRASAGRVVRKGAREVERLTKKMMSEPKSGRIYKIGTREHQASAPGQAPAVDTGALMNSIQVEMESDITAVVFSNMEYAVHLEFGTRTIMPRPFFEPATELVRPAVEAAMKKILRG